MIELEVTKNKTIIFDGEEYADFYDTFDMISYVGTDNLVFLSLRNVVFPLDTLITKQLIKQLDSEGYTRESWGYWKFGESEIKPNFVLKTVPIISLCLFKTNENLARLNKLNYSLFGTMELVSVLSIFSNIHRVKDGSHNKLTYSRDTLLGKIPKWLRYASTNPSDKKHKYKLGSPLPHALIEDEPGVYPAIYFFDRSVMDRFREETRL